MEGEQEGREKAVREKGIGRRSSKTGAKTELAMILSVTKEATIASAGDNGACSNGRCRENKRSSGKGVRSRKWTKYGGSSQTRPLCNGD